MTDTTTFLAAGRWQPERTGDYARDCATGRQLADELVGLMKQAGSPLLFGNVVRCITEGGVYEGVEIGFCSAIGITLIGLVPAVAPLDDSHLTV